MSIRRYRAHGPGRYVGDPPVRSVSREYGHRYRVPWLARSGAIPVDMSTRVIVRRPQADEVGLLGQIEEEADSRYRAARFPELADTVGAPADFARRLTEQGRLQVAEVGGTIAGFIGWCIEEEPTILGISQVSVLTRFGQAGIGTRLLECVVELARSDRFRAVAIGILCICGDYGRRSRTLRSSHSAGGPLGNRRSTARMVPDSTSPITLGPTVLAASSKCRYAAIAAVIANHSQRSDGPSVARTR